MSEDLFLKDKDRTQKGTPYDYFYFSAIREYCRTVSEDGYRLSDLEREVLEDITHHQKLSGVYSVPVSNTVPRFSSYQPYLGSILARKIACALLLGIVDFDTSANIAFIQGASKSHDVCQAFRMEKKLLDDIVKTKKHSGASPFYCVRFGSTEVQLEGLDSISRIYFSQKLDRKIIKERQPTIYILDTGYCPVDSEEVDTYVNLLTQATNGDINLLRFVEQETDILPNSKVVESLIHPENITIEQEKASNPDIADLVNAIEFFKEEMVNSLEEIRKAIVSREGPSDKANTNRLILENKKLKNQLLKQDPIGFNELKIEE